VSTFDLASYERDGFLVLAGFLSPADCDALQARAAELVAGWDRNASATFSTRDQGHARDPYFRESGGAIRFFVEEQAPQHLNKIGHALHDLDPIFDRISRQPRLAALAGGLGIERPLLLQSQYLFKQSLVGGKWAGIRTQPICARSRRALPVSGSHSTMPIATMAA
jgi:phytanoyl-CoA hydroxylase